MGRRTRDLFGAHQLRLGAAFTVSFSRFIVILDLDREWMSQTYGR
jgi:hypothetical protein